MSLLKHQQLAAALALLSIAYSTPSFACSSCGCTLNSDWTTQGYASGEGTRVDIRFDYFKQTDYRHGTNSVSRNDVQAAGVEVQDTTINRNLTLNLDHGFNQDWAINVQVPMYSRSHGTYGGAYPATDEYLTSSSKGIGDIRVTGRYQGLTADHSSGLTFGLKLPTGETNDTFNDGTTQVDRGLQLGTGTTDLLLGGYHFGNINRNWDYFTQATVQIALNTHRDFRPGNGLNASAGVRYMGFETIIPQLQLNARIEKRESGAQADIPNSGATLLYISPGVTMPINKQMQAFGFLQVPLYQRVNGYQIEPEVLLSAGMRYSF
ncbi:hypothetical protein GALL_185820 [mine drainage metagenome]|uniref:Lipoprotein n=1 Tax=mine drainage metagenome TaxID=410659 RepID=A0A1J5RUC2_9ZZZZ